MNHIAKLTAERDELRATLADSRDQLQSILTYLACDKFTGPDSDYVHIQTDILPRLAILRAALAGGQ